MGRAVFSAPALDIVFALMATGSMASMVFAVVRFRTLLAIEAALEAALVLETKVAAWDGDLAAALPGTGEVLIAVDNLPSV